MAGGGSGGGGGDNVVVAVRVRPFNDRETSRNAQLIVEMPDDRVTEIRCVDGGARRALSKRPPSSLQKSGRAQ